MDNLESLDKLRRNSWQGGRRLSVGFQCCWDGNGGQLSQWVMSSI